MHRFTAAENYVWHLEPDLLILGNIALADGYSLKTTNGTTTNVIAGSATEKAESGNYNGFGSSARFNMITSFVQLNASAIIVVDSEYNCLRMVDRQTQGVSDYAGLCAQAQDAIVDGNFAVARFSKPFSLLKYDYENYTILIVSDQLNFVLRSLNVQTRTVTTISSLQNYVMHGISWENEGESILVGGQSSLKRVLLTCDVIEDVVGNMSRNMIQDGQLTQALLTPTDNIIPLAKRMYLVVSSDANRVRLVDLYNYQVYSLCVEEEERRSYEPDQCQFLSPHGLLLHNGFIYIGTYGGIKRFSGNTIVNYLNIGFNGMVLVRGSSSEVEFLGHFAEFFSTKLMENL